MKTTIYYKFFGKVYMVNGKGWWKNTGLNFKYAQSISSYDFDFLKSIEVPIVILLKHFLPKYLSKCLFFVKKIEEKEIELINCYPKDYFNSQKGR